MRSDAVTVSPYLGFGALAPAVDEALRADRAVIVLAMHEQSQEPRCSSPTPRAAQSRRASSTRPAHNTDGRGTVGVVVGATRAHGLDLGALRGSSLAPGVGAQGATTADLPELFDGADQQWLLPASSRSVLRAGPDPAALRAACEAARDDVESALKR